MDPKRELVIGAYAYMDGEKFVRISLAMDAIIQVNNNIQPAHISFYSYSNFKLFVISSFPHFLISSSDRT